MKISFSKTLLIPLCAACALSSCGWVDSAGNGNNSNSGAASSSAASADLINLPQTRIVQLLEQNPVRIIPNSRLEQSTDFEWSPLSPADDADAVCERVSDFDSRFAANSLQSACSSDASCSLGFQPTLDVSGRTVFDISVPSLKAPVALSYQLTATDTEGRTVTENFTFCAISINEPPVARDDTFTIVRGQTFVIRGNSMVNLLSNDSDDNDASNQPLRVNPNPVTAPSLASNFSLGTDGGFTYTAPLSRDDSTNQDRFVYEITDGLHTVPATVTLRIIDSNQPPNLIGDIPNLQLSNGEILDANNAALDYSLFFSDPDGTPLQFLVTPGSLPQSGNLQLSANGRLTGRVEAEDAGNYTVTVVATDGNANASGSFTLSIGGNNTIVNSNTDPVIESLPTVATAAGDLVNQQIIASDADGDTLLYSLSDDSPDFLGIDTATGLITGSTQVPGLYAVTVTVMDAASSANMTFFLRVLSGENQAPVVDDISNVTFDSAFNYDVSVFFEDPDGDSMTFTAVNLPAGIVISSDGVISGAPNANNTGNHFIVVTADDGRLGMASDGFRLRIR